MCDTHACVCSAKHIRKSTLMSAFTCVCLRPRVRMCGCELTCVCDGDDEDEEEAWGGVASGRR